MAKKDATAPKSVKTITRNLKHVLSDAEKFEGGLQMAKLQGDLQAAEERKKEVTATLTADVKVLEAQVNQAARRLNNGYEYRDVTCDVFHDFDSKSVRIVRQDTGEVLDERAMTSEELQHPLPLAD